MTEARKGLHVPAWAMAAVAAVGIIVGMGVRVGLWLGEFQSVGPRLCRIERAMNLAPWPTCSAAPQQQAVISDERVGE